MFGYAEGLKADVALKWKAWASAPLGLLAGIAMTRRLVRQVGATIVHGHWVVPGGAMAALAAAGRPLVVSLHGSDVFVAERHAVAGTVARRTFARACWVTACSSDLRERAVGLGADAARSSVIPYGVDAEGFPCDADARARGRALLGVAPEVPLVLAVGRFVKKKGFEYLIDAVPALVARHPAVQVVLAGHGDLEAELRSRAWSAGVATTGVPEASASSTTFGRPSTLPASSRIDGTTATSAAASASGTDWWARRPGKRT